MIVIVMDSVGIGFAQDASKYGDEGANTLGHIQKHRPIACPTMDSLGLSYISSVPPQGALVKGFYGTMEAVSAGKDTTSGHWEIMGHPVENPFPTYEKEFPIELMERFTEKTGYSYLGNEVASGTEIINRLGEEHIKTGKPIVYTSADSVFQIAAHEDVIPVDELYRICRTTRDAVCVGEHHVGRVIARPFTGTVGHFVRTSNRHDYSRLPSKELYWEVLTTHHIPTVGVGKIGDIFASIGIQESYPTISNSHGMMKVAELMGGTFTKGLLMLNLVDFDSLYGHRRDVEGYGRAIEVFDDMLAGLMRLLKQDDLLILTADHGNDPTWHGTDHTRERVPLLGYYKGIAGPIPIGHRKTFSDLGQSILDNFNCPRGKYGESFMHLLKP